MFEKNTVYSNNKLFGTVNYYKNIGYTLLTLDDLIFEDDKESKEPKEYTVKIEVKKNDVIYRLLVNNILIDSWSYDHQVRLADKTRLLMVSVINKSFTSVYSLQEYLLENHFVDTSIKMTIKEIEEKLGIENLEIIE